MKVQKFCLNILFAVLGLVNMSCFAGPGDVSDASPEVLHLAKQMSTNPIQTIEECQQFIVNDQISILLPTDQEDIFVVVSFGDAAVQPVDIKKTVTTMFAYDKLSHNVTQKNMPVYLLDCSKDKENLYEMSDFELQNTRFTDEQAISLKLTESAITTIHHNRQNALSKQMTNQVLSKDDFSKLSDESILLTQQFAHMLLELQEQQSKDLAAQLMCDANGSICHHQKNQQILKQALLQSQQHHGKKCSACVSVSEDLTEQNQAGKQGNSISQIPNVNEMTFDPAKSNEIQLVHSENGSLVWRIPEFSKRFEAAQNGSERSFSLPAFFTPSGYHASIRVYLNGDGLGKSTHLSMFFTLKMSQNDDRLKWPFALPINFLVMHQENHAQSIVDGFKPNELSSCFQKPKGRDNVATGCPKLISINNYNNPQFIKDDALYIGCKIG